MASEVVPDVLSGLVAVGTLALASATVYLGKGAARAATDAVSPRVVVTWLQAEDEARNRPAAAGTGAGAIRPGTPWPMGRHGVTLVGMRAMGQLRNESAVTALVRFECGPSSWGDGAYPTWIGRAAGGRVTCFIADMLLMPGNAAPEADSL